MFPYASYKVRQYTIIFGLGLLTYHFGSGLVAAMTGDAEQQYYLMNNRNAIVRGTMPFDKPYTYFKKEETQENKQ